MNVKDTLCDNGVFNDHEGVLGKVTCTIIDTIEVLKESFFFMNLQPLWDLSINF